MTPGTMSEGMGGRPAAVAVALRHRPGIAKLALVCGLLWPLLGQAQFLVSPLAQPAHDLRAPGRVDTILKVADGRYLVGGLFTRVGNLSANGAARLQADGSPDASFVSAIGNVTDFAVDSQGRVYACNGDRLVRLTAQGAIDSSFPAVTPDVNTQTWRSTRAACSSSATSTRPADSRAQAWRHCPRSSVTSPMDSNEPLSTTRSATAGHPRGRCAIVELRCPGSLVSRLHSPVSAGGFSDLPFVTCRPYWTGLARLPPT